MTSTRRGAAERNNNGNGSSATDGAGPSTSTGGGRIRDNMVSLNTLNPYITCPLCNGYFVDATTVIDCLHTFCKSCLLKYFEDNTDCPKCHCQIHQSHPSHYVAFDRTMQDIVYKLVPGMQAEEQRRQEQFKQRQRTREAREQNGQQQQAGTGTSAAATANVNGGTSSPSSTTSFSSNSSNGETSNCNNNNHQPKQQLMKENSQPNENGECCSADQDPTTTHRRNDEPVLIQLLPDDMLEPIERSLVRLSAFATINTVKRLLSYLLFNDITKYNEFDLFCNCELMGRDFSMAFIKKTRWRNKTEPVLLTYKERLEF